MLCPNCGNIVIDKAPVCPYCEAPISTKKPRKFQRKVDAPVVENEAPYATVLAPEAGAGVSAREVGSQETKVGAHAAVAGAHAAKGDGPGAMDDDSEENSSFATAVTGYLDPVNSTVYNDFSADNSGEYMRAHIIDGPRSFFDPVGDSQSIVLPDEKDTRKKHLIIGAIIAAIVLVLIVIGAAIISLAGNTTDAATQAAADYEMQHKARSVTVNLDAPAYKTGSSRIPVLARGADLDGNAVNETFYIDGLGYGVSLLPGTYVLSFPAACILSDGNLYVSNETYVDLKVDATSSLGSNVATSKTVAFSIADPLKTTIDQINSAYYYALQDPHCASKAESLKTLAVEVRDKAIADEKKKKDAEKNKNEEKEGSDEDASISTHFRNGVFEFDIPQYWTDKVSVVATPGRVDIFTGDGIELVTLKLVSEPTKKAADDSFNERLTYITCGTQYVELWRANNPYRVWDAINKGTDLSKYPGEASKDAYTTAIDLESGGRLNYEMFATKVAPGGQIASYEEMDKFLRATIGATLKSMI